jgi:hypothetical protein
MGHATSIPARVADERWTVL